MPLIQILKSLSAVSDEKNYAEVKQLADSNQSKSNISFKMGCKSQICFITNKAQNKQYNNLHILLILACVVHRANYPKSNRQFISLKELADKFNISQTNLKDYV